ncbi:hypothetical protein [Uliginosibacterium sediminicola]|uniref:Uncharacterized protein n=1 Tax=Uliginosibacterium sediminicola TaxID=2024550 RepID=A0ABU9YU13_9RHOO
MSAVKFDDLLSGFEFSSADGGEEYCAYVCRASGKIWLESDPLLGDDFGDELNDQALPEDLHDTALYVPIPHKRELDLGRALVMRFVAEKLPAQSAAVRALFQKRGAYSAFKSLLERHHALQTWFDYEKAETELALRNWCMENDIPLSD